MKFITTEEIPVKALPGRGVQKAVGLESAITSNKMTISLCTYNDSFGPMEPHNHAEETIYIVDVEDGWILAGDTKDHLPNKVVLKKGMIVHFDPLEWHVFQYGRGGYIVAACIYGQVTNIRPEEILASEKK